MINATDDHLFVVHRLDTGQAPGPGGDLDAIGVAAHHDRPPA